MRHIYDAYYYVLDGAGQTHMTLRSGEIISCDWHAGSAFTIPANADYHHHATVPARLICVNDMRYLMGVYRNEAFIFDNPARFLERQTAACHRDLCLDILNPAFDKSTCALGDSAIAFDIVTLPPHSKMPTHRQMQGQHMMVLSGEPHLVSFSEGKQNYTPISLYAQHIYELSGIMFHQCFNPSTKAARLLLMSLGAAHAPIFRSCRFAYGDHKVYASGKALITEQDEPPALRALWQRMSAAKA